MFVIHKILKTIKLRIPRLDPIKLNRGPKPHFSTKLVTGNEKRESSIFVQEIEGKDWVRVYISVTPRGEQDGKKIPFSISNRRDQHDMSQLYAEVFRVQELFKFSSISFKGSARHSYIALTKSLCFDKRERDVARSVVLTMLLMLGELEQNWHELVTLADLSGDKPVTIDMKKPLT